ncbi:suppressor of fused domain protein [Jatrophihabitans endophyticus]|uniref:suppressor of fused domain protein n=1 Tax=Jatrophihabitans endophyticus TaxID=1206085 RepID=UPI0019F35C61|nr:suppressor of fused domain protein [Jatrophihabitans endophyticus]MBE7188499.1 suppressor of fused domain protein [Jatrophihabitans endophyticus]
MNSSADLEAALADHFGHRPARASVSFVGVDPIDVLRFEPIPGERAYVSSGMSRHPMTGADAAVVASDGPRAELLLHLLDPSDRFADVWRRVALLAAAPAVEGVVYVPGMTVEIGEPLVPGSHCVGVVVSASPVGSVPTAAGPVDVLQITPATSNELAWARVRGAAELEDRWRASGTALADLTRPSVSLD